MSKLPADDLGTEANEASVIAREYVQLVEYYEKLTRLLCKLPEWRNAVQILDPRASKVCEVYHSCTQIRTLIDEDEGRNYYTKAKEQLAKLCGNREPQVDQGCQDLREEIAKICDMLKVPRFVADAKFEIIVQMDEILLQIELFDKEHYFRDDEALMLDRMNGQLLPAVHRKMIKNNSLGSSTTDDSKDSSQQDTILHEQYTRLVQELHSRFPDIPPAMLTDIAQKAIHNPKLAEEELRKLKSQYSGQNPS